MLISIENKGPFLRSVVLILVVLTGHLFPSLSLAQGYDSNSSSGIASIDCSGAEAGIEAIVALNYGLKIDNLENGGFVSAVDTTKTRNAAGIQVGDRVVLIRGSESLPLSLSSWWKMCRDISLLVAFERKGKYIETILSPGNIYPVSAELTDFPVLNPFSNNDGNLSAYWAEAWSAVFTGEFVRMSNEDIKHLIVYANTAITVNLNTSERLEKNENYYENFQVYQNLAYIDTCFPYGASELKIKTTSEYVDGLGNYAGKSTDKFSLYHDARFAEIMQNSWDAAPAYGGLYQVFEHLIDQYGCNSAVYLKFYNQLLKVSQRVL